MCNPYSLDENRESVAKMFNLGHNRSIDIPIPGHLPELHPRRSCGRPPMASGSSSHELGVLGAAAGQDCTPRHQRS